MNNLTFCLKNGIELFLGRKGLFITLNGYIKLSGKPKQTISERTTRALLAKKIIAAPTLKIPGRSIRNGKLIPFDLALEWLAKDNPELAKAVDGDLMGWLSQPQDLSQFHKAKAASPIMGIPIMDTEIVPATEPEPTTKITGFSLQLAQSLMNSGEEFPVDFEQAWQWLGYTRKNNALDALKSYFEPGLDFCTKGSKSPSGGRPSESYYLTVSCLKEFGMIAKTEQGKLIRKYFLECEQIAKQAIAKPQPEPTPPPQPQQLTSADRIKLASEADKLFEKYGMDTNPRYSQAAKDFIGDILGMNQNALPAPDAPKWYGVAERAEQLGYPVALVVRHRSPLGCWVAKRVNGSRKESHLCNGTERPINLYPVTPQLDEAIASYFATHQLF